MTEPKDVNAYGVKTKHKKTIDGHRYTTTLYPAGEGFDLLPMILEVAKGPVALGVETLQAVLMQVRDPTSQRDLSPHEVRQSMSALAQAIVAHGGSSKVREMLAHTRVQVGEQYKSCERDFDFVFQGRQPTLFKVLAWVLEVNFAPFLRGALSGASSRLIEKAPELQPLLSLWRSASTSRATEPPSSESPSSSDSTPPTSETTGPSTT